MKRRFTPVLLKVVLASALLSQAQTGNNRPWVPAVYRSLTVGTSTQADALRVLGNPRFSGREQDTGYPVMIFAVSEPVRGRLTIHVKRGVIDGMTLIPEYRLAKKTAVKLFGAEYVHARYASDDCLDDGGSAPLYETQDGPIEHLEYRSRGLALVLQGDLVEAIVFVHKPFGATRSRCSGTK